MSLIKNFTNWFNLKPKLNNNDHQPPFVEEGHFWWCYCGDNIGTEINGKGQELARPYVIYKKLSRYTFLAIPCSTQLKTGSWFVRFVHGGNEQIAVLSQIKVIDYRRLKNKIGLIDEQDFENICTAFDELYSKKNQKISPQNNKYK